MRGIIAARPGAISLDAYTAPIERGFALAKHSKHLLLAIESPGGSAAQSDLIGQFILRRAAETGVEVTAVIGDQKTTNRIAPLLRPALVATRSHDHQSSRSCRCSRGTSEKDPAASRRSPITAVAGAQGRCSRGAQLGVRPAGSEGIGYRAELDGGDAGIEEAEG